MCSLLKDLQKEINKNKVEKVCEVVLKNPGLLNLDNPISAQLRRFLIGSATFCNDQKVTDILIKFLKLEKFFTAEKHRFTSAVIGGNVRLAEFFLVHGAKIKNGVVPEMVESVFRCNYIGDSMFKRVDSRKSMLRLLKKYGLNAGVRDVLG